MRIYFFSGLVLNGVTRKSMTMSAIVGDSQEFTLVRSRVPLQPLLPKNKNKLDLSQHLRC